MLQLLAILYRSTCNTYPACRPTIELHHTLQIWSRAQCWITRDGESQCAMGVHLTCHDEMVGGECASPP